MTPEEQEHIKSIAIIAAGAGVLGGAAVSAVALIYNGWRQRHAEARKHFRELALQAALAEWTHQRPAVEKWFAIPEYDRGDVPMPDNDSFDLLLVEKLALLQQFGDGDLSPEALKKRINGYSAISKSLRCE